MAKAKTECPVCGCVIKGDTPPELCPRCETNLTLRDEVVRLSSKSSAYAIGEKGRKNGAVYLTTKRLFAIQDPNTGIGQAADDLIGNAIEGAATGNKGTLAFSIPLDEIASVEEAKLGLLGKALAVSTRDGKVYKLSVKDRDTWRTNIEKTSGPL